MTESEFATESPFWRAWISVFEDGWLVCKFCELETISRGSWRHPLPSYAGCTWLQNNFLSRIKYPEVSLKKKTTFQNYRSSDWYNQRLELLSGELLIFNAWLRYLIWALLNFNTWFLNKSYLWPRHEDQEISERNWN